MSSLFILSTPIKPNRMKKNKKITIKDLSKYLSLSTSTVSRAFSENQNINSNTKKRILEAAKKFDYKPNRLALSLKSGQTKNIGVIVPEMITPYAISVIRGIENVLYTKDYQIIVKVSDEDKDKERDNILFLENLKVDALIVSTSNEAENIDLYQKLISNGTPIIFYDRIPNIKLEVPKVIVKDAIYSSLMVEHLVSIGKKKIVHILGPDTIRNAKEREIGYDRILKKHQLYDKKLKVKVKQLSTFEGKKAIEELIHKNIQFDAIFAFSDILAIGAMNFLLEKGYKIPKDVAVASFSGTILSSMLHPQLTTVESPLEEMGEKAALLTLEKIENPTIENKTIVLDSNLAYRSSTYQIEE